MLCPVQVSPWDAELRIMRADCYEAIGDYIKAISDIKYVNIKFCRSERDLHSREVT